MTQGINAKTLSEGQCQRGKVGGNAPGNAFSMVGYLLSSDSAMASLRSCVSALSASSRMCGLASTRTDDYIGRLEQVSNNTAINGDYDHNCFGSILQKDLLVRRDVQLAFALSISLLAVGLTIAPWKRRRVVGIAVRHGHVIGVLLAFTIATLPIPLIVAPAHAQGCDPPPPTPTPPPGGDVSHFHTDHLGSTQVETNQLGNIIEQIRYRPYGEVRGRWTAAGDLIANPSPNYRYEFTGYETELKSGLYNANARFYDPSAGMFLSHDPKRQFASPYAYGPWDPVNGSDPSGAFWLALAGALITASIAASIIDTYVRTGDAGAAFKAGAITHLGTLAPPGTSFGFQLVAPKTFGEADAAEYTIGLIPVVGSARAAAQNFESGYYASGVVASAQTIVQVVAIAYGVYQRVSQPVQANANGTVYSAGDAPSSSGGCGCGGEPPFRATVVQYVDLGPAYAVDGSIQAVPFLSLADPVTTGIMIGASAVGGVIRSAAKGGASFFKGSFYGPKVLNQMTKGAGEFHSFPEAVTAFENAGVRSQIVGGDGIARQMLEIPGSYASSSGIWYQGVFQFIKDASGEITHRLFVPGP